MSTEIKHKKKRLSIILGVLFAFALLMGPGPGMYLVNPDINAENPTFTFMGMPILYVWAVFWYFVEAAIVLSAYFLLWNKDEEETS